MKNAVMRASRLLHGLQYHAPFLSSDLVNWLVLAHPYRNRSTCHGWQRAAKKSTAGIGVRL